MIGVGLDDFKRSVARVLVGGALATIALLRTDTAIGGMAWVAVVGIACLGYGTLFKRLTRQTSSTAMTVVTGLALLLTLSTVFAQLGVLGRQAQIIAALVGIAACISGDDPLRRDHQLTRGLRIFVVATVTTLIGAAVLAPTVSFDDQFNHVLVVKRLWDTGHLGLVHHQSGAQLLGESFVALMSGARSASAFEQGFCTSLLLYVLASELATTRGQQGLPLFFVLAVPLVLWPGVTSQWSGVLFHAGAFVSLRASQQARERGWSTCVIALALVLLRHEYALVALPYIVIALVPKWTRRKLTIAIVLGVVGVIVYQVALAVPPVRAVIHAALFVGILALLPALRTIVAAPREVEGIYDAIDAVLFAVVIYLVALVTVAIRPAQHTDDALFTVCLGAAIAMCVLITQDRTKRPLRLGAASAFLAVLVMFTITWPNLLGDRGAQVVMWTRSLYQLKQTLRFGGPHDLEADVAVLQREVPAHARIGFWGASAGQLDYARNRIVDVSRHIEKDVMPGVTAAALTRIDYLLVENIEQSGSSPRWDTRPTPVSAVESKLQLVATTGGAFLFSVRR